MEHEGVRLQGDTGNDPVSTGTQHPIAGVMKYNVRSDITGCLRLLLVCRDRRRPTGWASADYLVVYQNGSILEGDEQGAATGIPVVAA